MCDDVDMFRKARAWVMTGGSSTLLGLCASGKLGWPLATGILAVLVLALVAPLILQLAILRWVVCAPADEGRTSTGDERAERAAKVGLLHAPQPSPDTPARGDGRASNHGQRTRESTADD